jgi:hypothetical protein
MSVQTINSDLMDLSIAEQEILSGGQRRRERGTIEVDDAVFRYGGEEYPARIRVTVRGLPRPRRRSGGDRDDED